MHPLWPAVFSSVAMCEFGGYISHFSVFVVTHLFDFDAMRSDTQIFLEVVNVRVKSKIFVGINLGWCGVDIFEELQLVDPLLGTAMLDSAFRVQTDISKTTRKSAWSGIVV